MVLTVTTYKDGFWFRLNGKGLSVTWNGRMLFSERNGYEKMVRIGKLKIKFLK
jgi:hypothetical protein